MGALALTYLGSVLQKNGVNLEVEFGEGAAKGGLAHGQIDHELIVGVRKLWREMGDTLSRQYTGTDSTISVVSEGAGEGFFDKITHKLTSATRLVKNTITNNSDQECIDILLGRSDAADDLEGIADDRERLFVEQQLLNQEGHYTGLEFLKVNVCSWNLGGVKPLFKSMDLTKWLLPFGSGEHLPDIIIVGFQEIVTLNVKNVLSESNSKQLQYWSNVIQENLDAATLNMVDGDRYIKLREESLVGIYNTVWVKKCHQPHIRHVQTSRVYLGKGGFGNKGSAAIRLQYRDSCMAFACCHLESGQKDGLDAQRRGQMESLIKTAFVNERGSNMQ